MLLSYLRGGKSVAVSCMMSREERDLGQSLYFYGTISSLDMGLFAYVPCFLKAIHTARCHM